MGIDDGIASQAICNFACMASPWLAATGMTLVFSALFSKIWRLHSVFKNAMRFQRVEVKAKDVILPLVVMLSLNVIFLTIWTVLDPLYFERVYFGRTGSGEISSYGQCTADGVISKAMLFLILGVNMMAIVLANFQAYQARNISTEYSESKWIAFCMVSILQAMMIGTPILILASTNPTANFIVWSMLIFVICMSILGLLFVPKFISKRKPPAPQATYSSHNNPTFTANPSYGGYPTKSSNRMSSSRTSAGATDFPPALLGRDEVAIAPDDQTGGESVSTRTDYLSSSSLANPKPTTQIPASPRHHDDGLQSKNLCRTGDGVSSKVEESTPSHARVSAALPTDLPLSTVDNPKKSEQVVRFRVNQTGEVSKIDV